LGKEGKSIWKSSFEKKPTRPTQDRERIFIEDKGKEKKE